MAGWFLWTGKSHENGWWFRGTPISGNHQILIWDILIWDKSFWTSCWMLKKTNRLNGVIGLGSYPFQWDDAVYKMTQSSMAWRLFGGWFSWSPCTAQFVAALRLISIPFNQFYPSLVAEWRTCSENSQSSQFSDWFKLKLPSTNSCRCWMRTCSESSSFTILFKLKLTKIFTKKKTARTCEAP